MQSSALEILLLPGMDGTGKLYLPLIAELSARARKSAPAYPAEAPLRYKQLLRIVETEAPERPFLLVAESFSTPLAILYAATHPKHLKGLVLCAGFATSPVRGWPRAAATMLSRILFLLPLPGAAIERFLLGRGADRELVADVRAAIRSANPRVLASRLMEILRCDVRAELRQIEVPVLYLAAQEDRLIPPRCLEEILQEKPDVVVKRIPGPHLLFQRAPQTAAKAIEEFARSIQG